ncbi:MAG: GYF domain-containing protein [Pirellulales bacterium]
MANEWYVQHGGKQYGPLTPGNLKKLAADGKITPATSVRLGAEGAWVPASKVQGLFAAAPAATAAKAPRAPQAAQPPVVEAPVIQRTATQRPVNQSTAPAAVAQPVRAVPQAQPVVTAPPIPPPVAATMAAPPWARPPAGNVAPHTAGTTASKVLGVVAIVFGAAALATFWLPLLGGMLGWIGIIVGSLGLLVGIIGLIVAAVSHGAGLILNVAGTGSSIVGLVLAVVMAAAQGMFTRAAPPPLAPAPTPVVVAAQQLPPVEPEPEPTPPPEPVWTEASQPIEQGPIKAGVASVGIEQVRLESGDLSIGRRQKPKPMLKVRIALQNISSDRIVSVPGWVGGGDLIGQGVGQLLGEEAGQAVQAATASARLADNVGNAYKQTHTLHVFGAQIDFNADHSLRPGDTKQVELIFNPPVASIEYLRLELTPAGFSGEDSLRFQIPRAMITGLPAVAGG